MEAVMLKQKCPVCGETFSGNYTFCPYDGTKLVGALASAMAFPTSPSVVRENPNPNFSTEAPTDDATGLKTHLYFLEALKAEVTRSTRLGQMFSVIRINLDGFKQVKERHGRLECDEVLTAVANLLRDGAQQSNVVARFGSYFAILMPETPTEQAEVLAERLRAKIESDPYLAAYGVTASCGIATFPVHGPTHTEIIVAAHAGIDVAQQEGGNRVRVASRAAQLAYADVLRRSMEALGHKLERLNEFTLYGDPKNPSTQHHLRRVSRLAVQVARQMGLTDSFIKELRLGGVHHDIGMMYVPKNILRKPPPLTPEEFEIVKTHASKGAEMYLKMPQLGINPENVGAMVRHHHEAFDGSGYPDGLKCENIPLGARIIAVAEAFDAIVSDRVYQQGRSVEEAVAELRRCSGTQFDPKVVDAFVSIPEETLEQVRAEATLKVGPKASADSESDLERGSKS
jgi:diguanylate cyclase (GGDEF)-like protein